MARVTLSIAASPDGVSVAEQSRTISIGQNLIIGRGDSADWKLEDARKVISALHCTVESADGEFFLDDKSTNGTFLNGKEKRMDGPHKLADGDSFKIGAYQFGVTLVESDETGLKRANTSDDIWAPSPKTKPVVEGAGGGRGDDPALAAMMHASDPQTGTLGKEGMTVIRPGPPPVRKPEAKEADTVAANADQKRLEAVCYALAREVDKLGQLRTSTMQILGSRNALLRRSSHSDDQSNSAENWVAYAIANVAEPQQGIEKIVANFAGEESRLLGAINAAAERMAGAVAPPQPEAVQGDTKMKAWFARYQLLWGETAGDWNDGFVKAFMLHLAAAYDEMTAP